MFVDDVLASPNPIASVAKRCSPKRPRCSMARGLRKRWPGSKVVMMPYPAAGRKCASTCKMPSGGSADLAERRPRCSMAVPSPLDEDKCRQVFPRSSVSRFLVILHLRVWTPDITMRQSKNKEYHFFPTTFPLQKCVFRGTVSLYRAQPTSRPTNEY